MRFSIDVGSELELKLYQAVLLYRNDHGSRFMATVHGVVQKETDGTPLLGSGQLLSTAALRELTKQLGTSCPAEFLPEKHEFTRNLCQPSLVGPPQPNLSTMSARHPSVHKRLPASFICTPKPCSVRPEKAHFPPTRLGGIGSVGTFISPSWTIGFALS